jgi:ceramide glucosyltransferase
MNDATLRLALTSAGITTAWIALGLAALRDVLRAPVADVPAPPVTVLKPLAGADPSLAENLESFFAQDHPDHEILFGCEDPDDPAVPIVRALLAAHPEVRARLVIHEGPRGSNPKVRNLRGLIEHASHDLVLVSDSNVRAPRGYVREAACAWGGDVGLVTNLFAGAPREGATVAAWVESVLLAGFCAPGAALPTSLGHAAVIGKSMLFSRREIASFGGLERVADVMAEDYVLGRMFQARGRRVRLAPTVIENTLGAVTWRALFDRHLRWSMMRLRLHPHLWFVEPWTSPLVAALALGAVFGARGVAAGLGLMLVRDLVAWCTLHGPRDLWAPLLLGLPREAVMIAVWVVTPFKRHVRWRGHTLRLESGTLLYDECETP